MGFSAEPPPKTQSSNFVAEKGVSMPGEKKSPHTAHPFSVKFNIVQISRRLCPYLVQQHSKVLCPSFQVFPAG